MKTVSFHAFQISQFVSWWTSTSDADIFSFLSLTYFLYSSLRFYHRKIRIGELEQVLDVKNVKS